MTADFFAEEVRRNLIAAYGEKALYESGLTVMTTLDPAIQEIADVALREGLIAYDRRHGWRGPYAKIADMKDGNWEEEFARIAQRRPLVRPAGWMLAVVTKVDAHVGHDRPAERRRRPAATARSRSPRCSGRGRPCPTSGSAARPAGRRRS